MRYPPTAWPLSAAKLFTVASILVGCLPSPAVGKAYDYGFDVGEHLSRRSFGSTYGTNNPFVVGGLGGDRNGTMPARQEIRQMEKDTYMWTLYILGLNLMQYTDQSHLLSYYQIAGQSLIPFCAFM